MTRRVAFLGTGLLGEPIARKISEAGTALCAWNRTPAKAAHLTEHGAEVAESPASAAVGADVVLVCLSDESAVAQVLLGPGGALETAPEGAVVGNLSTIGPSAAERIASSVENKGARYVEVPVIGSGTSALRGQLVVLEGGRTEDLVQTRAVLEPVTRRFIHCGTPSDAAKAKLAVNTLLGILNQAIAEGYCLGLAMGLPSELVLDLLSETPAKAQVERKRPSIASGNFEPSFKLRLLLKDLRLALEEARRARPSPRLVALESIEELVAEAVGSTWGELDYSSIAAFLTGHKPAPPRGS